MSGDRPSQVALTEGHRVGPFTIVSTLGEGQQVTTYRAMAQDGSVVALKHISLTRGMDLAAIARFERDAEALEHLDHPSIPRVHPRVVIGDDHFIAQGFVEGRSLADARRQGVAFDEARLLDLAEQVLEVLDWLHTRAPPVVHGAIKPSHLLLRGDGRVMLTGFGLGQGHQTQWGEGGSAAVSAHGYRAPEQLVGRAEPASDLYGFAATLIYLVTGKHPGDVLTEDFARAVEAHSPLSAPVNQWLQRMLSPDPRARPPSAAAALTELRRSPAAPAPPVVGALGDGPPHRWRDVRRFPPAVRGGFAFVVVLLLAFVSWWLARPPT